MSEQHHNITRTQLNWLLVAMLAMVAVMFAISAYAWFTLPAGIRVPVHWNFQGQPNRYTDKTHALLIMPCVAFGVALIFRIIPVIEPRQRNLLRSFVAYRAVALALTAFFLALHAVMAGNLLHLFDMRMNSIIGILVSVLLLPLGNYMGKVRSNFMFGIRTPWTLTSNVAWDKTHRLGGRLLFLVGLAGIVVNLVTPVMGLRITLALLFASLMFMVLYSWLVWRTAPDRQRG